MEKIYNKNDSFEQIIKEGKWLVDFSASWCGPCRMLEPNLKKISEKINILKIDIDANEEITSKYNIMSVPTLILFENGAEVDKSIGYKSVEELEKFIN